MPKIDIYVRPSGDRVLLNLYMSETDRQALLEGLQSGSFASQNAEISLEVTPLEQWKTGADEGFGSRLRIPISAINVHTGSRD